MPAAQKALATNMPILHFLIFHGKAKSCDLFQFAWLQLFLVAIKGIGMPCKEKSLL